MEVNLGNPGVIKVEIMKKLFDYVFYRVYKAYKKKDSTPEIYATNILALMQFFLLLSALAIIRMFFDFTLPNRIFIILIIIFLLGVNWYQYGFRVDVKKFEGQWGEEDNTQRKQRGWLIVVSLISLILFPILIGVLKHNLGVI